MNKKVLVIGSGFTGPHVAAGFEEKPGYRVFKGKDFSIDITDKASIRHALEKTQPDIVINLAAIATLKVENVRDIYEVNGFGVLNLLEALRESDFSGHFITASSAQVYGIHTPGIIEETQIPVPANHYSCAKLLAEHVCDMYRDYFSITIPRVFNCIGRGHRPSFLVPKIVQHFRERKPFIELGNIKVCRDYVDIRDIARMYVCVTETTTPPQLLHFCTGTAASIETLIHRLTDITGHKIEIRINSDFIRGTDNTYMCGAPTGLCALGFQPQYSLEGTLKWMLEEPQNH